MEKPLHPNPLPPPHATADDFWVRVSCADDGRAVVEAMGQLRLGVSDVGVNADRNAALFAGLRQAVARGALPAGKCTA